MLRFQDLSLFKDLNLTKVQTMLRTLLGPLPL